MTARRQELAGWSSKREGRDCPGKGKPWWRGWSKRGWKSGRVRVTVEVEEET